MSSVLPEAIPRPRVPAFMKIMSGNSLLGLILSIVPGLAHFAEGRFREVRWFVLGWFLSLIAGIFFYGSSIGLLLLGLAVGLHGWIAFSHALAEEKDEPSEKIRTLVILLIFFSIFYWGIRRVVFQDFVFGLSNLTVPYQKIQQGDTLLGRRSSVQANLLARGSLVIARFPQIYNYKVIKGRRYETTGEIAALPGEKIEIIEGRFVVNGRVLDGEKFPVPGWMSGFNLSQIVPDDRYFVSTTYNIGGYGMNVTADLITDACILSKGDIEAIAVMRWFPLNKRGFLGMVE